MLKRKDKILISAIELFDAEGINGLTTKNLAQLQNVSEPALYRQFKGKQDIINHIIEEFAAYDEKIMNTIAESGLTGKVGIEFYVKRFAELYQNYSELTTVMFSMDLYQYQDNTRERMQDIISNRMSFLVGLLENEDEEWHHLQAFNSVEKASLINGTIFSQIYEWRMSQKSYPIDERLWHFIERIL